MSNHSTDLSPKIERRPFRSHPMLAVLAIVSFLLTTLIVAAISKSGGHFTYSLDDPYIHLALARGIAQGHYGLNLSEASAPSSSILWPFLLALFAWLPGFEFVPLVLNVAFALLAVSGIVQCFTEIFGRGNARADRRTTFWSLATFLAANGVALALTGMEHDLQIWLSALAAFGLIRVYRGESMPRSLPVALAVAPLVRYENLAISLAIGAFLAWRGERRAALAATVVPLMAIVAFSVFLRHEGLGIFPSSVMAKSPSLARIGGILPPSDTPAGLASPSLISKLTNQANLKEVLFLLLAVAFGFPRRPSTKATVVWGILAFAVLSHLIVGEFGSAQRYQMYLYAFSLVLLVFLRREGAVLPLPRATSPGGWLVVAAALALISTKSLRTLYDTPLGCSEVYRQQHQMMRFVHDYYQAPVAVNDLGEVAYGGGQFVLDLWGLASKDALRARLSASPGTPWMEPVVERRKVGLVMVYSYWFPTVPASWQTVGWLRTRLPLHFVAGDTVTFYATPWADRTALRRELAAFAPTLPPGASFDFAPG